MFRRLFESPRKRAERLAAAQRWPVMEKSEQALAHEACASRAADIIASDGITGFISLYQSQFASLATSLDQTRCYALIEPVGALDWDDPDITVSRAQLKLRLYENAYEETGRSPAAAALYGKALISLAAIHNGVSWPERLSRADPEKRAQLMALAQDVFDATYNAAEDCPLWHRTRFSCAIAQGCSPDELEARFFNALRCDRAEHGLFTTRALTLLPCWYGSLAEIERFARHAPMLAAPQIAPSLYARIYSAIARHVNLRRTDAEWPRLKESMWTWHDAAPSQRLVNEFAAMAELYGDEDTLAELLETRLTAYFPDAWLAAEQAADVFARMTPRH